MPDPLPASETSAARAKKSVDRTLAWADLQLRHMRTAEPAQDADSAEQRPAKRARATEAGDEGGEQAQGKEEEAPHIFGAVQGGGVEAERLRCAAALAAKPELSGFVLSGFGIGEAPSQRDKLIRAVVGALPPEKPRVVNHLGSPEEVLRCVVAGVDLFGTDYPFVQAAAGCALVFDYDGRGAGEAGGGGAVLAGLQQINLHDAAFVADRGRLTERSAVEYSRAYIHHLLATHELLGFILLATHNLQHYLSFFAAVRARVRDGTIEEYAAAMLPPPPAST